MNDSTNSIGRPRKEEDHKLIAKVNFDANKKLAFRVAEKAKQEGAPFAVINRRLWLRGLAAEGWANDLLSA
jgi:hypothetical protein